MTSDRLNNFLEKHRIITSDDGFSEVSEYADLVERDGNSIAMYVEQGYWSYSIYTTPSYGNPRLAYRIAMILAHLNKDKDISVLNRCMDIICSLRYDSDDMLVPRKTIESIIEEVISGQKDVLPMKKKWYFLKKDLNKEEKKSIICTHMNETVAKVNFSKVEFAVRELIDSQTEHESFITINDIVSLSGLSKNTVKKYMAIFRDEINECNIRSFDTDNYSTFIKHDSVGKISSVIEKYREEQEMRLTKTKVSKRSKLHYNTVKGLWFEDEVQLALDRYNKWKNNSLVEI